MNTMLSIPHEISFGEIYLPPLLVVMTIAYLLAIGVSQMCGKLGWHKYIYSPAIAEFSLMVIFVEVFSQFIAIV
ncbi:DUF1656 domain-containing protein [Photobacterium rosenbergii]|nr:DUF1656 domain-containing protein [Photobacterium rosenbergii]MBY5947821.1 DUF1656 domain-containing protein [Photobacterium rosenbergii]